MASFQEGFGSGQFLPTTEIIETSQLREGKISDDQMREILIRIVQAFNDSNTAVNNKDIGFYLTQEIISGQNYFSNPSFDSSTPQQPEPRQVFRKVINFGALPDNSVVPNQKSVAHGITVDDSTTFTRIYATASDTTNHKYISIPYQNVSSDLNGNLEIYVDDTFVYITGDGIDWSVFDTCYVVLEYLKS